MQKLGALGDRMWMARNLLYVLKFRSARREKHMAYAKLHGTDDLEVVFRHKVIYCGHASDGGVLYRKDSVIAHALLHCGEHIVESLEVEYSREVDKSACRLLGIGAFHAGTRDRRRRRKTFRC